MTEIDATPPSPAPWRRRFRILAEFVILFGGLALIDRLTAGGSGFARAQPNPYWLPVLVFALAYGTELGVAAAIVASWIWLAHAETIVTPTGDYLDRLLQLSLTPLLWFLVAALVGEVTNLRARRAARVANQAAVAGRNVDRLSRAYGDLTATNRALQVRIAIEEGSVGRAVALASRLADGDAARRRATTVELIALAAGTSDFTCYRFAADGAVRPWLRGASLTVRPDILPEPLVRALRGRRHPMHVARADDRALLGELCVAAVPLVAPDGTRVIGALVLHSLPFAALNAQALAEIAEIGDWLPALMTGPGAAADGTRTERIA